ncbi:MAG: toxin-activating lysine-acyltransferase [Cypionkella sp.]
MTTYGKKDALEPVGADTQVQAKMVDPVAGKTVAEILGEIVWLMTQDPAGRELKIAEIEALIMPAILQKRFHIKYSQIPDMRRPGATTFQPVSVEVFSSVNNGDAANGRNIMAAFRLNRRDQKEN